MSRADEQVEVLEIERADGWACDGSKFGPDSIVFDGAGTGIAVSVRLAAVAAENERFMSTSSSGLFSLDRAERPQYRGYVFAIVEHPEHGLIAVTPEEFRSLELPQVTPA